MRVEVRPDMLRWARERAGLDVGEIARGFPRYADWESGDALPTLKQLEGFADKTHISIGYFFMDTPPEESVPIPDFRTLRNQQPRRPSSDLLETIYLCQYRQEWYRDYCLSEGRESLSFVGSVTRRQSIEQVAASMRKTLGFDLDARSRFGTWEKALGRFITGIEDVGIMVMRSGVVLGNNKRKLKVKEFRGFALADEIAPLIFINGSDTKSAQMFTLAHELAHLWLGRSALSTAHIDGGEDEQVEQWCNKVAAELLVPLDVLRDEVSPDESVNDVFTIKMARRFKVSTLVVLRRLLDLGVLTKHQFDDRYGLELKRLMALLNKNKTGGGDFYRTQVARTGKRFLSALFESTLEGRTLYRDAMKMVGIKKVEAFHRIGSNLDSPI